MSQVFFSVHPMTVLLLIGAAAVVTAGTGRCWPGWAVAVGFALGPVLLEPVIWYAGAPCFGWRMGGLGAWLYLRLVLPLNGLAFGIASVPLLTVMLGRNRNPSRLRVLSAGLALQALTLVGWLAIASRFHLYVGNLST